MTYRKITLDCPLVTCQPVNNSISEITVSIAAHPEFHWQAGQYVNIHGKNDSRPYTIATYGSEKCIFYIQHTVNYNRDLIAHIKQNGQLTLTGPLGDCIYHSEPADMPLLIVAGGTGFAQLRAITEAAFTDPFENDIHAFWGVRRPEDFHSLELLQQWQTQFSNFKYTLAISENIDSWQGEKGLIPDIVLQTIADLSTYRCYASGPSDMVRTAKQAFIKQGLHPDWFYCDE